MAGGHQTLPRTWSRCGSILRAFPMSSTAHGCWVHQTNCTGRREQSAILPTRMAVCNTTLLQAGQRPFVAAFKGASRNASRVVACRAQLQDVSRRQLLQGSAAAAAVACSRPQLACAAAEPPVMLCDTDCTDKLSGAQMVTTPSGLQYKDLVVGGGAAPVTGFQVLVRYVAMTPEGRVFESSLEKGPFDIRVGAGQVIPGLDEGLATMRSGGLRRMYIPGSLAFTKPLKAAPGRPTIPANTPVVFDVQLLYIPGLDDE